MTRTGWERVGEARQNMQAAHSTPLTQSDVWSYGVTAWEILTRGKKPFQGMNSEQVMKVVERGGRLERPPDCTVILWSLLLECWDWEMDKRPSFVEIRTRMDNIMRGVETRIAGEAGREAGIVRQRETVLHSHLCRTLHLVQLSPSTGNWDASKKSLMRARRGWRPAKRPRRCQRVLTPQACCASRRATLTLRCCKSARRLARASLVLSTR